MVLEFLQYISIVIEAIVAILGLFIVFYKKKNYGWGIFLTFAIYVVYDFSKFLSWKISSDILYVLFFIATASILCAVFAIYKNLKKR